MKQEIIKLDPKEYGLEESKAKQISEMFTPMLNKMVELEEEANEVFSMDKTTEEAAKKSKEVRLKYVKVRTGTAEIHKAQKAFYLAGGRFIDGWKNAQILASQGIEEKLLEVENYAESIRKQEIEKLFVERSEILTNLRIEVIPSNVGSFDDELWNTFLSGARFNFNKKQEELAAAKKEAERMEAEAIELAKKQKEEEIKRLNNERVEREEKEKELAKLKAEAEKREKEIEAERKANEEKLRVEREKAEQERLNIEAENNAKLKVEQEAKAKLERELSEVKYQKDLEIQTKKEAEIKAEQERLVAIESELNKGDASKIEDLINDLSALKTKYSFKSKKNIKIMDSTSLLIDKVINYIKPNQQ